MKTTLTISLIIILIPAMVIPSFARERKKPPAAKPGLSTEAKEQRAGEAPESEKSPLLRVKVKIAGSFTGTVTSIDFLDKTITLKNRGVLVTFDVGTPALKGYKALGEVRVGHVVRVNYFESGLAIQREGGKAAETEAKVSKPRKESTQAKPDPAKAKPGRLVRVAGRTTGNSFDEVDENKDNRITAVELSVIRPGLTLQQYKEWDKNGDGSLDRNEFMALPWR